MRGFRNGCIRFYRFFGQTAEKHDHVVVFVFLDRSATTKTLWTWCKVVRSEEEFPRIDTRAYNYLCK